MKRWGALGLMCLLLSSLQPITGVEAQTVTETAYFKSGDVISNVYRNVYESKLAVSLLSASSVSLDLQQPQELTMRFQLEINQEHTAGWQYTAQLSNFTIKQQRGKEIVRAEIMAASVSFLVQNVASEDAHTLPVGYAGTFASGDSQTVLQAEEGEGKGRFEADLLLKVALPPSVQIVSVEGGSDLKAGQQIGLLSGEYRASLVSTLVAGL
ncbi:hypothetical protein [Paenibacillus sonchi]|uniref:hypothetical protein n=1 Tax=Paenibacillus sonchi TaxID=373687 RepID=UPI000584C6B7|nr:hypothetical protein [Paenibacillus sonchi]